VIGIGKAWQIVYQPGLQFEVKLGDEQNWSSTIPSTTTAPFRIRQ
jgi:hypothetical protein